MLADVAKTLAAEGWSVAVLARGLERLRAIAQHPNITALQADYRDLASFEFAIRSVVPVDLVVAWIHSTAPEAPMCLARLVARPEAPVAYHHVLGSAGGRGFHAPRTEDFAAMPGLNYSQTVLGYVREHGQSRWLTHHEIASGMLGVIRSCGSRNVVGTIDPWAERPGAT